MCWDPVEVLLNQIGFVFVCREQSSANRRTDEFMLFGKSFIYTRNNSGPSTVPWGTPETTSVQVVCSPPTTTLWTWYLRKPEIHVCVLLWMPYLNNLFKNPVMGYNIKSFGEIHYYHINLRFGIQWFSQVMSGKNELRFSWMFTSKPMLFVC